LKDGFMCKLTNFAAACAWLLTASIVCAQTQPAAGNGRAESTAGAGRVSTRTIAPRVLPGTSQAVFSTIQGNALSATDAPLPDMPVRLRDARTGRIIDTQVTDKAGLFTFRTVDPGNYVVELMGSNQSVLAASEMLNVESGQIVSTIVKLPFAAPPAGTVWSSVRPAALAIIATAAAAGVLTRSSTTDVSGETPPAR
jgi:hypothetical protein